MSLTNLLIPTYTQMLQALSNWLDKAQRQIGTKKAAALLSERLAPDMYPLASQIRFACLQAQEATFRLRGEPLPAFLDDLAREGRDAGDRPGSIAEAQARIGEALAHLSGVGPDMLDSGSEQSIAPALPNGIIFDMKGEQYARDWALPQFYFHLNTAYAILRHQKIDLGKADYVQHAMAYVRPGTMPDC